MKKIKTNPIYKKIIKKVIYQKFFRPSKLPNRFT
jgi:hypothetical protein